MLRTVLVNLKKFLPLRRTYISLPSGREQINSEYEWGVWDYLDEMEEQPRLSVVAAYCHYYKPGGSILDIGCGPGNLQRHLHPGKYAAYTGIDFSRVAIERASGSREANAEFICADAESYQPTKLFDVIIFSECLYYFHNPLMVVRRYQNFARSDFLLLASMHCGNNRRDRKRADLIWKSLDSGYHKLTGMQIDSNRGNRWTVKAYAAS